MVVFPLEGNGARPSHRGGGYSEDDVGFTLNAVERHAVAAPVSEDDMEYRVRRLTPKECALLQGFPDTWCDDLHDDDYDFWKKTLDEWCEMNGKKPKSEKQIRKFMENPYSEAAEYKMWGNGVALPCVWFIMEGIKWYEESKHR